jgi:hypothetical protein
LNIQLSPHYLKTDRHDDIKDLQVKLQEILKSTTSEEERKKLMFKQLGHTVAKIKVDIAKKNDESCISFFRSSQSNLVDALEDFMLKELKKNKSQIKAMVGMKINYINNENYFKEKIKWNTSVSR